MAKIDLQPFGFKPSTEDVDTFTDIKWWRQYVVIRLTYIACVNCGPDATYTYTPGPRLVIDSTTGKQAPPETVDDAVLEANPQDFPLKGKCQLAPAMGILAQWRGMTLVRDRESKLWLEEPGHTKILLFSRPDYISAVFAGPDRIVITGQNPYNTDSFFPHFQEPVVDKSGTLKYKLPSFYASAMDYYALSRSGSRFAVRDIVASKAKTVGEALSLEMYSAPLNVVRVRVFASDDGQKLFEDKWRVRNEIFSSARAVALSDNGTLLALIKGTDLLIFKVPSGK